MFKNFEFSMELIIDGSKVLLDTKENQYYSIKYNETDSGVSVTLIPKKKIQLVNAFLTYDCEYGDDKVYVNGYQSWTTSREYTRNDVQRGILGLANYIPTVKKLVRIFGDYDFQTYTLKKGEFHSYSYTYIKGKEQIRLLGSLCERNGYTVFHHDMANNLLAIQKDVEGVTVDSEYKLFDIYWVKSSYEDAFDKYFDKLALPALKYSHMAGYTSWYNYYGFITEEILTRDIDGLAKVGDSADIFQIDDGYQSAVGDWTTIKKDKYPHGMKYLVDKIHSNGYKAGLWLAPFNAQKSSQLVKNHPDWLIYDDNGRKQLGSIGWGGAYTLDFYKPEVAEYIKHFFNVVTQEWGFDMVKLDFLYSICRTPRYNKSRGQIMCEAMDFLRECVGDKIILGCGVPLFPSFGKVEFCRISSDVGASYKDPFFVKHSNQEIVSTKSAMNNSIFRRHLNGRAFVNDPDVFYLRDSDLRGKDSLTVKKSLLKFNQMQKTLLSKVNNMCGDVLFVSDNVGGYSEEQLRAVKEAFSPTDKTVIDAEYIASDVIAIRYLEGKDEYKLTFNTITGENSTVKC